jgi:DNA-binding transcriptional ArsR family regulator
VDEAQTVRVLKALADERRFRMVQTLAEIGELACGDLGAQFDIAQSTLSHHLKILVDAGVLRTRREGKHHLVSVDRQVLKAVKSRF